MNPTIKQTRTAFGMKQKQFGKLMGMKQPAIARIESGKRKETKQQLAQLEAINLIEQSGLLWVLEGRMDEKNFVDAWVR